MKEQLRAIVEEYASMGETVQYGELMKQVGLSHNNHGQRAQFGMKLRDICGDTFETEGFMLCSIVVAKATGMPSAPFFKKAREIGALEHEDEQAFFEEQRNKAFEFYGT